MENRTISSMERNISMYADTNPLRFYAKQGLMSDPREYSSLFSDLPDDIPALCKVVQGLLIHEGWAEQYGVSMSEDRTLESSIRMVSGKVDHIRQLDNRRTVHVLFNKRKYLYGPVNSFSITYSANCKY